MSFSEWQTWLLPAVLAVCVFIAMRHWRGLRERLENDRQGDGARDRKFAASRMPAGADDEPVELTRWRVEMYETAREIKAELDSKIAVLQVLLRDAEEHQRRLAQALESDARASTGGNDAIEPRRQAALPSGESKDLIYRLADEGRSCEAIAAQARVSVGDVELLLSLRPKDGAVTEAVGADSHRAVASFDWR